MKVLKALIKFNTCKKLTMVDLRAMAEAGLQGKAHRRAVYVYTHYTN